MRGLRAGQWGSLIPNFPLAELVQKKLETALRLSASWSCDYQLMSPSTDSKADSSVGRSGGGAATLAFLLTGYLIWQANRREMPPLPPLEIEPDFTHLPPREHPAPNPLLPRSLTETEDS